MTYAKNSQGMKCLLSFKHDIHPKFIASWQTHFRFGRTPATTPTASEKGDIEVSTVNGITVVTEDTRSLVCDDL